MGHGLPDGHLSGKTKTVYALLDMAELAARLGSPNTWDRRGAVILQDTFEHGLGQANILLSGLNAGVALEGGHAWQGAFCAKLTTGSSDAWFAEIRYHHGWCVNSRIAIEFTFTLFEPEPLPEVTVPYWIWVMFQQTVAGQQTGQVRYDFRTNTLEYLDGALGWTPFATDVTHSHLTRVWHTGKLVIDYRNQEYVRFILNDQAYPLMGLPMRLIAPVGAPYMLWSAKLAGQDGKNQVGYVDNVVITQNEL